MNSNLNKKLIFLIESIRKEPLFEYLNEMKKNDYLPLEKLIEIRNKKFIKLINFAYNNSIFYKEFYSKLKIDLNSNDVNEIINELPILTKELLQENKAKIEIFTNHRKTIAKTSGSTGNVLKFVKDREATAIHNALYYRGLSWHGLDIGLKEATLWGIPISTFDKMTTGIKDFILNRFREKEYNLKPETMYGFYKKLIKKKPDILSGYSSMILQFSKFLDENKLDGKSLNLKLVKCTSETVTDETYDLVQQVFGCPLVVEYGSAESGILAFTCEYGNIHLFIDYAFIELQDHSEENLSKDYKEIIVTPLYNFSFPIIRYKLGDYILPKTGHCQCGRELPIIDKIVGRTGSVVYTTDGSKFHSTIFDYIFKGLQSKKIGGVAQFQVIQYSKKHLVVKIVRDKNFSDKTVNYITDKIKEKLGQEMKVDINIVPYIERQKSGKLRDFISLIGRANHNE